MSFIKLLLIGTFAAGVSSSADAQDRTATPALGAIQLPLSSVRRPQPLSADLGVERKATAFTNVQIFVPSIEVQPPAPGSPATQGYYVETPASIGCIYGLTKQIKGCNPNVVFENSTGGQNAIGIVDAFDAPNLIADLKVFSERFNLPAADFTIVFATGSRPIPSDESKSLAKGWELEESLDVEWAHAIAPSAKIVLVEAASNSIEDLLVAEDIASKWVSEHGGGEISNSWGVSEFTSEPGSDFDGHFKTDQIAYFAASGDSPGVTWPSTSPNVVCVGGTGILRDTNGDYLNEVAWSLAGAGSSQFYPRPVFQNPIAAQTGNVRGCVDVSAIADPSTGGGVWVYDSGNPSAATNHGWEAVGGTSAATPIIAGMANIAGRFAASSQDELNYIYGHSARFFDVTVGSCGPNGAILYAGVSWDFCTGVGRPIGKNAL
jgi:kumamolisin